ACGRLWDGMSALGHKRTHAAQHRSAGFSPLRIRIDALSDSLGHVGFRHAAHYFLQWSEALLLLRDLGCACRPHGGDLDDHLAVLCPYVMRRLRRLGIERARGISLECASASA